MLIIPSKPPMGWNSWDVYLGCPDQETLIKTADTMAETFLPYGYQYFVIDALWYENQNTGEWSYDRFGRLLPDPDKFPFGMRYFSEYLHSKGLKFGLHMMRGMNRSALSHGYQIFETDVPVDELYDSSSPCKWADSWAGIKTDHPLAGRWYESIVNLFAEWGVDFIKYDDLIDPDNYAEIVLIHNAIEKCGREMVLSLSPGNKCVTKDAEFYSAHSSMWRISGDYWDNWEPQTKRSFRLLAQWNPYIDNPGWPDADMLPLGRICEVASVHGDVPRDCRLNEQEQHSLMTLFSIAKSPLFLTCNLLKNEKRYFQIQTNRDCIAVNQNGRNPRVLWNDEKMQIWTSYVQNRGYLAIFNLFDETAVLSFELPQEYIGKEFTEVWTGKKVKFGQKKADLKIKAHDVFFLRENMDSDID